MGIDPLIILIISLTGSTIGIINHLLNTYYGKKGIKFIKRKLRGKPDQMLVSFDTTEDESLIDTAEHILELINIGNTVIKKI